jgi:hypothetical protein
MAGRSRFVFGCNAFVSGNEHVAGSFQLVVAALKSAAQPKIIAP